ncbi:MAG: hypothetical protein ACI9AQ_000789 [Dinoroseobacter sp.]|jgi:hypothetical protein
MALGHVCESLLSPENLRSAADSPFCRDDNPPVFNGAQRRPQRGSGLVVLLRRQVTAQTPSKSA